MRSLEKLAMKIWFPFNFAKNLKDRYFAVGESKNLKLSPNTCFGVTFQENVLLSFLLFSSVCYEDGLSDNERNEIPCSGAHNFNNSWLLYVKFSETIKLCRNSKKLKLSTVFIFEIKGAKKDKIFNFLEGRFSVMGDPIWSIWHVFRDLCEASKKYNFAVFFQDIAKVITI